MPIYLSLRFGALPQRPLFLTELFTASLYFRLPMPVQPLTMRRLSLGTCSRLFAAGTKWELSSCIGDYGRIEWFARYFTRPIVKGVQLGVGLMLGRGGFFYSPALCRLTQRPAAHRPGRR